MPPVETAYAHIYFATYRCAGKTIHKSTNHMAQRMTTKCIPTKQDNIHRQHQCAYTNAKRFFTCNRIGKPQPLPNINREKNNKEQSYVKKVPMNILYDQGKRIFSAIFFSWLRNCTRRWIGPKGFVVCATEIG